MEKTLNNKKKLVEISKTMSYLLRHGAKDNKLDMDSKGFIKLDDLLNNQKILKLKADINTILHIVETNDKKRFEILDFDNLESTTINPKSVNLKIRAVQGHTLISVKNEDCLKKIDNIYDYSTILHGTYFDSWELIKLNGLNKMSRNCIHFAIGEYNSSNVVSGMRGSCQLIIEIDGPLCVANDIEMYISKNNVILSPGINGVIQPKFFKKVYLNELNTNKNYKSSIYTDKFLMSCTYSQAIFINFNYNKKYNDGFRLNEIALISFKLDESFKILIEDTAYDSNCNNSDNKDSLSKVDLNNFSNKLVNNNYNKDSTCLVMFESDLKTFKKYFLKEYSNTNNNKTLNHFALFNECILISKDLLKNFEYNNALINNNFNELSYKNKVDLIYNLGKEGNLKGSLTVKIHLDYLEKKKKIIELTNTNNSIVSKNHKELPYKIQVMKDVKNSILDNTVEKHYIILFVNYDEDNDLDSIDYAFILNSDFENENNYKIFKSETLASSYSSSQKNYIQKLFDEMRDNLNKYGIFSKLLILAGIRDDINFLTRKMRKAGYKVPNIFQNNVIELFKKDFCDLKCGEIIKAIKLFYIQYMYDNTTIKNKVKIINNM